MPQRTNAQCPIEKQLIAKTNKKNVIHLSLFSQLDSIVLQTMAALVDRFKAESLAGPISMTEGSFIARPRSSML